jgi:alpha-galactosidase
MCRYITLFATAAVVGVQARRLNTLPGFQTPQMAYNSWYDVMMNPSSEKILATAKAMTSSGLQKAGYKYINLDDGIVNATRGPDGNLAPTPAMGSWKDLSDALHAQNFLFGIYTDRGPLTCGGRAAAQGHEAQDAAFYAANGVDYVKEDSCNAPQDHPTAFAQYAAMRDGLDATGREIFFSLCGWEAWYSPVMVRFD